MDTTYSDLPDDDLSSAMGTETLLANSIVPEGLAASSKPPEIPVQVIGGVRYLRVEQSANRRNGSKISKIWQHRTEIRALDSKNLDKHWLCNLCLPSS